MTRTLEPSATVPDAPAGERPSDEVDEPRRPTAPPAPPPEDRPRRIGGYTLDGVASYLGAALGALALDWIVYENVLAWTGTVGFLVCWWLLFLATYALVSSFSNPRLQVLDRLVAVVVASGAGLVALALLSIVWHIFRTGFAALHHLNFYTQDMSGVRPNDPLTKGGISHVIVGTIIQIGIATAISFPLGIGTAIYLSEVKGRLSKVVRTVVEAMTALPDILAGLFIYTTLMIGLGWYRSGLTAALALSVTMIPIIARSAEVSLRIVPGGLREAGMALGASQWAVVRRVVLPTARSGLVTALILGIARVAGETAPLLIVSGNSQFWNVNPLSEPMNSLPLFIITSVRSGQPEFIARGYGAAGLLLGFVLVLFSIARFLARDKVGHRVRTRRPRARAAGPASPSAPSSPSSPSSPGKN